jgi:hypothetical protein
MQILVARYQDSSSCFNSGGGLGGVWERSSAEEPIYVDGAVSSTGGGGGGGNNRGGDGRSGDGWKEGRQAGK